MQCLHHHLGSKGLKQKECVTVIPDISQEGWDEANKIECTSHKSKGGPGQYAPEMLGGPSLEDVVLEMGLKGCGKFGLAREKKGTGVKKNIGESDVQENIHTQMFGAVVPKIKQQTRGCVVFCESWSTDKMIICSKKVDTKCTHNITNP